MPSKTRSAATATLWTTRLDRASPVPLSRQLAGAMRQAIGEGRIGGGARLPSTRVLAGELGLARSTVVGVFEQLAAEGYIAGKPGSGYVVAAPLTQSERAAAQRIGGAAPAVAPWREPARLCSAAARPAATLRAWPCRDRHPFRRDLEAAVGTRAVRPLATGVELWRPARRTRPAAGDRRLPCSGARRALRAGADRVDLGHPAGVEPCSAGADRSRRRGLGRGPVLSLGGRHLACRRGRNRRGAGR